MNVPRFSRFPHTRVLLAVFLLAALVVTTVAYQLPITAVVDVGSGRDAPFVQGFSFRENLPDGSDARWSTGRGEIRFTGVGMQSGTLTLRFAAPRPNGAARVNVLVNGSDVTPDAISAGMQDYRIGIDRTLVGAGGDLIVTLAGDTFSQPPDSRQLGLLVDSASFQADGAPALPSPRVLFNFPALVLLAYILARVWSGSAWAAFAAASAVLGYGMVGLVQARVETAYFLAPLFWLVLALFAGGYLFSIVLRRLTGVLGVPPLTARTLRLVFLAMVLAFAVRIPLALTPGYIVDVQDYIVWSYKTVTHGLGTMYAAIDGLWISDQSPGLNYILHVVGLIYRGIFAPDFLYPAVAGDPALRGVTDNPALLADPVHRTLLRMPMLLADVMTGALILTTARKYVTGTLAWFAAFAFWLNPAVLWNGAYWGQTDAIHSLLVLVCFLLIVFTPRIGLAFFILGIAAFTKPQAMFFGPLLLLGAYRSAQVPGGWRGGLNGVARAVIWGALGSVLLLLPILLTGGAQGLLAYLLDAVGHHPTLSANAHNLWWVVFHDDVAMPDTAAVFPGAPLSYRSFSILLFVLAYLAVLVKAWRAPLEQYFVYGAFVAFAFFMLPTEIHENYGYALLPLLAVAMTRDARLVALYLALSVTMTLNYALHDPWLYDFLGLNDPHAQLAPARWLNAVANVTILGVWLIYSFLRRDRNVPLAKLLLRRETVK